ncbi:MAG: hypothetical protein S4CHLAM2_05900 [Chlamydiales bacterium]|nr:hypothetical protein [Chlamydiales bacterium]
MRQLVFSILVLVFTCSARPPHCISDLKRELCKAQKELATAESRVRKLEEAIAYQEIQQIEDEIKQVKATDAAMLLQSRELRLAFFSAQRETLATIIHDHPVCAVKAQAVLDQILTLITHVSDAMID